MNTVSSLEKEEKIPCKCRQTMAVFPLEQFLYAVKGLLLSLEFSFLGVILVPEEFVSSLIYSIYNI